MLKGVRETLYLMPGLSGLFRENSGNSADRTRYPLSTNGNRKTRRVRKVPPDHKRWLDTSTANEITGNRNTG
jgi:hypothetical protein